MNTIFPVNIRTENFHAPLGIACRHPEFSWQMSNAVSQSAWQIMLFSLPDNTLIWDSGKVYSSRMAGIKTPIPLKDRCRFCFKVRLWNENDLQGAWSEYHFFETGIFSEEEFDAMWIGFSAGWSGHALCFRKEFELEKTPCAARLYVASGAVKVTVNGIDPAPECFLQPPQSDYEKSYHVQTYDVTKLLRKGRNILFFHAGNGWFGAPVVKYRLEADGTLVTRSHVLSLPEVFKSAVSRHSIFGGEEYDANSALRHDVPLPANKAAMRCYGPVGAIRGIEEEPVSIQECIQPVSWKADGNGTYTVDFGRNFAGVCKLSVNVPRGTVIKMRFAEQLYPDGRINQENLQGADAADTYTASGDPAGESYIPSFTYHGFRYVEISGLKNGFTRETLTGLPLRNNCRRTGFFKCSDELLNRIFEMMLHTEESNLFAVPTDCPQRTERMGWLNDMMARNEGALYLFDESNVYSKYLRDISEAQDKTTGEVPMTSPCYWGFDIDPVCSSFIEIARNNALFYGKVRELDELYPDMSLWIDRMLSCCDADGILRQGGFVGDWVPPLVTNGEIESPQNTTVIHGLISTALMHYAVVLLKEIAGILNNSCEVKRLENLAKKIQRDFAEAFFATPDRLAHESQSEYACAIYCGLFAPEHRKAATDRLAQLFAGNNCKHTTGNIGTKYLLDTLSQAGYTDLVMELVSSTTYPGWGYMLENGATTVWERWETDDGKRLNSLNHPMLSAPCVWMFRHLAGIKISQDSIGADVMEISPCFAAKLDFAEAVYDSRAGRYFSRWERCGRQILHDFEIPPGCRAYVRQPDGSFKTYVSGKYSLIFENQ